MRSLMFVFLFYFLLVRPPTFFFFFFFNDTATTEIYTLSLHDALPISGCVPSSSRPAMMDPPREPPGAQEHIRSEEHTSELQSPCNLVCRLLLEKKKKKIKSDETRKEQHGMHTSPGHIRC